MKKQKREIEWIGIVFTIADVTMTTLKIMTFLLLNTLFIYLIRVLHEYLIVQQIAMSLLGQ